MNIKQAKEYIKDSVRLYLKKNEFGEYRVPVVRQRPIFLLGAPGIGKTAIMEQIAQEMGIALVSYSMTHHTRQSALGLPYIQEKVYDGQTYRVSEYTMSEIIASVYEKMEQTGVREGILFLDEINCVSETLAPAMLQFLQYKVFGQHRVPDGWIVVTAGNPPEYNQSVREFDMATWDRLKRMDVEPEFEVWHNWAVDQGVHPAVTSYLDIHKEDFYKVEATVEGRNFVTPRGWVDLSEMIKLYEQHSIKVDDALVRQYIQNGKIARQFAIYYDLWLKYSSDYQVDKILAGKAPEEIELRAQNAKFDERLSLVALLMDAVLSEVRPIMQTRVMLENAQKILGNIRRMSMTTRVSVSAMMHSAIDDQRKKLEQGRAGSMLSGDMERTLYMLIQFLTASAEKLRPEMSAEDAVKSIKADFDDATKAVKKRATAMKKSLEHMFAFAEKVYGEGQEMLILVTELTASDAAARFIAQYGCDAYFRHNKSLLFYERQVEVIREIDRLEASIDADDVPEEMPF